MQIRILKDFDNRPDFVGVAWTDEDFNYHIWLNRETLQPTHGWKRPLVMRSINDIPKPLDLGNPMVAEAVAAFVEHAIS